MATAQPVTLQATYNGTSWDEPNVIPVAMASWDFLAGDDPTAFSGGMNLGFNGVSNVVETIPAAARAAGITAPQGVRCTFAADNTIAANSGNQAQELITNFQDVNFRTKQVCIHMQVLQPINYYKYIALRFPTGVGNTATWEVGDQLTSNHATSPTATIHEVGSGYFATYDQTESDPTYWWSTNQVTNVTKGETVTFASDSVGRLGTRDKFMMALTNGIHNGNDVDGLSYSQGLFSAGLAGGTASTDGNATGAYQAGGEGQATGEAITDFNTVTNPSYVVDRADNGTVVDYWLDCRRSGFEGDTDTFLRLFKKAQSTGDQIEKIFDHGGFLSYWVNEAHTIARDGFNYGYQLGPKNSPTFSQELATGITDPTGSNDQVWYYLKVNIYTYTPAEIQGL